LSHLSVAKASNFFFKLLGRLVLNGFLNGLLAAANDLLNSLSLAARVHYNPVHSDDSRQLRQTAHSRRTGKPTRI
jgi:hypothetical protein